MIVNLICCEKSILFGLCWFLFCFIFFYCTVIFFYQVFVLLCFYQVFVLLFSICSIVLSLGFLVPNKPNWKFSIRLASVSIIFQFSFDLNFLLIRLFDIGSVRNQIDRMLNPFRKVPQATLLGVFLSRLIESTPAGKSKVAQWITWSIQKLNPSKSPITIATIFGNNNVYWVPLANLLKPVLFKGERLGEEPPRHLSSVKRPPQRQHLSLLRR